MNEEEKYIGQMLDDRYEILETIGEGGMAIVFRALDHRLNRYVAVKIMREEMAKDEEFRRRFCAESHAVAMLSNPNIVSVYDVSHSDEREFIVMELISGITLKQYMDKRVRLIGKKSFIFPSRSRARLRMPMNAASSIGTSSRKTSCFCVTVR
jgi:serine/threonine-protein kinase